MKTNFHKSNFHTSHHHLFSSKQEDFQGFRWAAFPPEIIPQLLFMLLIMINANILI